MSCRQYQSLRPWNIEEWELVLVGLKKLREEFERYRRIFNTPSEVSRWDEKLKPINILISEIERDIEIYKNLEPTKSSYFKAKEFYWQY